MFLHVLGFDTKHIAANLLVIYFPLVDIYCIIPSRIQALAKPNLLSNPIVSSVNVKYIFGW